MALNPAQVAKQIRELFCREMKRRGRLDFGDRPICYYDGGLDSYRRNHKPVWDKAAKLVIEHGLDPAVYVCLLFGNTTRLPVAADLCSTRVLHRYRTYLNNLPGRLTQLYRSGVAAMHAYLRSLDGTPFPEETKVAVALDKHAATCASHLLHYCLAAAAGRVELAAPYREMAIAELAICPDAYRMRWPQGVIPPDILNEALRRRARFDSILTDGT